MNLESITAYEDKADRDTVENGFDLTHGAPILKPPDGYVEGLQNAFARSLTNSYSQSKIRFLKTFFERFNQHAALEDLDGFSLYTSSSAAILNVAIYLKKRGLKTATISPTLDLVPQTLSEVGLDIIPVSEEVILPEMNIAALNEIDFDALFLALPNNPTGRSMSESAFRKLATYCKEHGKVLIFDLSFHDGTLSSYDQYKTASEAGCDFMAIEDTGKGIYFAPWLKVGMLYASKNLRDRDYRRITEIVSAPSPFILEVLSEQLNEPNRRVLEIEKENREYLRSRLLGTILSPANPDSKIGVEWLKVADGYNANDIAENLRRKGIYVLPGTYFYWDDPGQGSQFIRISLAREPEFFKKAVDVLVDELNQSSA